jgi:ferritin-like metal-binding protein YciE
METARPAHRSYLARRVRAKETHMTSSNPTNLKELYIAEIRDLWSANDQMQQVIQTFAQQATDQRLKQLFERSVSGINEHTQALRQLVEGESDSECEGMKGLVQEAKKHALEADLPPALLDLELVTQYQRMSHYGLAGFGTAAAYAEALGLTDQAQKLRSIVSDIYKADEYSSQLAERAQEAAQQG